MGARFYAGSNSLAGGAGHAFVGVELSDGIKVEIHDMPDGGPAKGGQNVLSAKGIMVCLY